jgi:hypothetical protein
MCRHFLFLLAIGCLGLPACGRPGPRPCPEGMSLANKQSKPGQFIWCRGRDGKRAQYIEFQPGGNEKRQICDFREGRAEGPFTAWFPGGKVWIAGRFAEGRPDGRWTQWNKAGSRVAEGEYRDGRFVAGAPVAGTAVCDKLRPP